MAETAERREWVKPAEFAKQQGISRATAWEWARKGLIEQKRVAPKTGVRFREPTPPPRAPK